MKKIFQKNQVILTALAIMIAVAGYLNFTQDDIDYTPSGSDGVTIEEKSDNDGADEECKDDDITDGKKDENEGESEDVLYDISEQDVLEENTASKVADGKQDDNKGENTKQGDKVADKTSEDKKTKTVAKKSNAGEAILVSKTISLDTIYSAKLNREQDRAKNKESLLAVVNDEGASQKMKDEALNKILNMTSIAEKELSAETLLAAKGFENCIVSVSEDSTDVIVDVESISNEDATVIMDAVKRKTGTQSSKIVITPVNSAKNKDK